MNYPLGSLLLLTLLALVRETLSAFTCSTPFQQVPFDSGYYCAKCDTSCATCAGPGVNECSTCPTDFTLVPASSTCTAPSNDTVNTVASNYHSYNFEQEPQWVGGSGVYSSCGVLSVLRGASGNTIYTSHSLGVHYKIRVLAALYSFSAQADSFTYQLKTTSDSVLGSVGVTGLARGDYSPDADQTYDYYAPCTTIYATNMDGEVTDGQREVRSAFHSTSSDWGVREYIFIEYLCYEADCASCSGPLSNECDTCVDSNKIIYEKPATSGPCLCDFNQGYYAYPDNSTYYCVNPCPNLPSGQYYGDNFTYTCVTQCPLDASNTGRGGLSFASDYHGFCVKQCPTSIILGSITFSLYFDYTNRRCTAQCPTTQPYINAPDRTCYTDCPINGGAQYYKLKTSKECVEKCPNIISGGNVHIPLYRDPTTFECVERCPDGYWGYENPAGTDERDCVLTQCPSTHFADNSSGRPVCSEICPEPNFFGDYNTLPPKCVDVCTFGTYGDQNDANRECVPKCNSSWYGYQSGNRQCMQICPTGTWGERKDLICVQTPQQCNAVTHTFASNLYLGSYEFDDTNLKSFADNTSRMCVYSDQLCSDGQFKRNDSFTCQLTCPDGSYANPITYWCVDRCYGSYFGDPTTQRCVLICPPGYWADLGSGNTCVQACNQTGGYPYRDDVLRQCVSVCSTGYYSDPIAQSCVTACTVPLYLNGTDDPDQNFKKCLYQCTDPYFGYNNTDSGICVKTCPDEPITFGDIVDGQRRCEPICQMGTYGDQVDGSFRHCVANCQANTFAQNDTERRCVTRCNSTTFGREADWSCVNQQDCPHQYTGDITTNMCVNRCPESAGTFGDNISKLCVSTCPTDGDIIYYAQIHDRWCIQTCDSVRLQFGNNSTQTCQVSCLDNDSFADAISTRRYCIDVCTNDGAVLYYRNNYTKTCVITTGCSNNYFGDNSTEYCVDECPIVSSVQTWGYEATQTCVALCYSDTWGDNSNGVPLCVAKCPSLPMKWSYDGPGDKSIMLCTTYCPSPYFGEDFDRTCVLLCPRPPAVAQQTYAYDVTRRCLYDCPDGTYADYIDGVCFHHSINCTQPCWYGWSNCTDYRWGDPYNNSCTYLCTETPWDSYGDNTTQTCVTRCANDSWADSETGTRICVAVCPGEYDGDGVNTTIYDTYGDNHTQRCQRSCKEPDTYADWQTHLCTTRCTGDDNSDVPTYNNIFTRRCVIAIFCPQSPDTYFGENTTRWCQPSCILNGNNTSFADNITRTCIPKCYQYTNASTSVYTMFYGDVSNERPACIIACPQVPRLFGENDTHLCVTQCPDWQYGDQTGNRTCVDVCPNIAGVTWFSQLTERICVLVCQDATWGNFYNSSGPHCETVGTDCKSDQFGDNSTHMCVPLCPQSMNYFGDPRSKLCTDRCPHLLSAFSNATAGISLPAGQLFADYKTRLCVYTCPADFGLQGTFGDNTTSTCVQRCPNASYGDAHTVNRFCVETCTHEAFADDSTMLCVDVCPASPPTFGYEGNWTCVAHCPDGLWADSTTRKCQSACNPQFRLSTSHADDNQCVSVCPSEFDLYGDTADYNCTSVCSGGQFADPTDRLCKTSCLPLFQYNFRCVRKCPEGFFAKADGNCVTPTNCDASTYGDNSTTQCVATCPAWSYADSVSRYCIAVCPDGTWGDNNVCVSSCQTASTTASNITQLCQSSCPNYTYVQSGHCVANCSNLTYQNDETGTCAASCPTGLYADPTTQRCVQYCPTNWYRQTQGAQAGFCVWEARGCHPQFADVVTGNCVDKCSDGYWGYGDSSNGTHTVTGNYTCNRECPSADEVYGYETASQRTCYLPKGVPSDPVMFADVLSGQFVAVCPTTPTLYYGDRNRRTCVSICEEFSSNKYYGDPQSRQCEMTCTNTTSYTADNATNLCSLRCTYGTFRFNNSGAPICVSICPTGYADDNTRICLDQCPILHDSFGYHNQTSCERVCTVNCPSTHYADPTTRTCVTLCPDGPPDYYGYNATRQCLLYCKENTYADDDINVCVNECKGTNFPNADNSTFRCVATCPSQPEYYAQNNVCVFYCTTSGYYADSNGRECVARCSNISGASGYNQYGDPMTGKCQMNCSEGSWGDNSTNLCVTTCPVNSFADNTTGKCVADCPRNQAIYADPLLHVCAYTCSGGRFGSQVTQDCIPVCDLTYWGDPTTTLCVAECPVKIYSFGENDTRTCVHSCDGFSGYADNYSRLCRDSCQNHSGWAGAETFIQYTTQACVDACPEGTYAVNETNQCLTACPTGFADNYTNWCVSVCPDDPQSYGDATRKVCLYECLDGYFSDNSTNLCVFQCPGLNTSSVDYYGDTVNGRCVKWCTEGLYAQNTSRLCVDPCPLHSFADNLTRRCVADCPPSQTTYADPTTQRCVRICPPGYWAQNTTQTCVTDCWTYTNSQVVYPVGTVGYEDNLTNYCVAQCPFGYFGQNSTHACVVNCSVTLQEYGHHIGRVCVAVTNCYADTGTGIVYYADPSTHLCVEKCPLDLWADTHIFKCVATCDASIPEFRNNNNQMCVLPCPSDPDEYADYTSGDCVRTCPTGSFASVANRTCVQSCGFLSLFADNSTHRCVSECNTQPYFYADNLTWKCAYHCSGGQFADNKTQTCVPVCPSQWNYFGELHGYTCVTLCPDGQFADALNGRTCRTTCSGGYFSDNYTSTCVQNCRTVRPFYYEDTSLGYGVCVHTCPGQSYGYNPDQTCKYQDGGSGASTCPGSYYADRTSRTCVPGCPNGTYSFITTKYCEATCSGSYYADPILRQCVTTCSANLFKWTNAGDNRCVQYCPSPLFAKNSSMGVDAECVSTCTGMLAYETTRTCQNYCPHPYFADPGNNVCVQNCTPNLAYIVNRTCLPVCEEPYYGNPLTLTCDLLCPALYFGRNDTRLCDTGCPSSSWADPSIRICVSNCPTHPMLFADDRSNQCLGACLAPLFAYQGDMTCQASCPNVTQNGTDLVYLADASNRMCVLSCTNALISYADYTSNECVAVCPNGSFASNYTKQCVPTCPNVPNDTFSQNDSKICMDVCLPGSYGMHDTLNCVAHCWWPYYADPTTRTCVTFCPDGYFAENSTATCKATCPTNSYADPVTNRCLAQCPHLHNYFNYDGNWSCLLTCPSGHFANTDTQSCVSICNSSNGMFSYGPTNLCVRQCPTPYRGYVPNRTCVLDCPSTLYFYDVTINQCAECDPNCQICISATSCTNCKTGFNLFNGFCNISCIPTTIITYADPSGVCVQTCPTLYYGDNSTYSCTQTCPVKQYGEDSTRLCTTCPATCSACTSPTHCSACESGATLAIDNMCYADCNSTHKYAYDGTCYLTCPDGSYLTYTEVTCAACSGVCATCNVSATNCLSCNASYFSVNTCVTQCPDDYYGAPNLTCMSCVGAPADACSKPLSFETSYTTENFQPVITLQFNQNVSLTQNLENILNINLQVTRRLLQVGTLVNNGITYTYQILSNGTIKLYPQIDVNLISPTFSVSISDPSAVISDETGLTLQNVQSLIEVASVDYYSPQDSTEAGTNVPMELVTIFVLLLFGVSFLFTDVMVRPIQYLQIFFLHAMIAVEVPANLYYHLDHARHSILGFLPNFFSSLLPATSPYYNTPQKVADTVTDEIFLRHLGQLFFYSIFFICLWLLFLVLGNPRTVTHKIWQGFFKDISIKRFQLMALHDVLSLFYLPLFYFAFSQFRTIFNEAGFYVGNGFVTVLFLLIGLVMPLVWIGLWVKKEPEWIRENLWFMTLRVKSGYEYRRKINDVHTQDRIDSSSENSSQMQQTPSKKYASWLQNVEFTVYILLIALWMVALYDYPNPQLILLIVTHLAHFIYLLAARPYLNIFNLIFALLLPATFITLAAVFLYFFNNGDGMTSTAKTDYAFPFIVTFCVVDILMVLWALWRFVWECAFLWQTFKKTMVYLEYADHDYVGEKEESEKYSQYEKMAQNLEAGLGDIVVDHIQQQVKGSGEKVIKVTKKRLRKKPKVVGRAKPQGQPLMQEEPQQQYVRVNQINVFDYDQHFKDNESKVDPIEPEPVPVPVVVAPVRRDIDDDIIERESSEDMHSEPEPKKIDVEYGEVPLHDLDDISQIPSGSNSQHLSQMPFEEVRTEEEKTNAADVENAVPNIYDLPPQIEPSGQDIIVPEPIVPLPELEEEPEMLVKIEPQEPEPQLSEPQLPRKPETPPEQEPEPESKPEAEPQPQPEVKEELKEQPRAIEDLLAEQDSKKKKNLMFLFDDFDEEDD